MNHLGDDLLACAGFALKQHAEVGLSDLTDSLERINPSGGSAYQLIRRKVVRYNGNSPIPESFALQPFQVSLKCSVFNSPHNRRNNGIGVNGLDKEVLGAWLRRLAG